MHHEPKIRAWRYDAMMKVLARDDRGLRDVIMDHGLDCDFAVRGRHILSLACASSSRAVVRELLAGGAPVCGSNSGPPSDGPLLVVVKMKRDDLFEELLEKAQKVGCVVPWTCLQERRYTMLDYLFQRGLGHDFMEQMTSEPWGTPQCRFMRKYLPVLVGSNVFLDKWRISATAGPSSSVSLPLSAVPLLLAARARPPKTKESSSENEAATLFLHSPQPLQDLARSAMRTYYVDKKMYEKLTKIFCSSKDWNSDCNVSQEDHGQLALRKTVQKLTSLPSSIRDVLFLIKEKNEFIESLDLGDGLPSVWLSFVVDV